MIKDPLTHMVRNSGDHGLETPAERRKAGKPETGRVTLNAYHEGGHIIIEISDDGRGLPLDKIKAKAVQNGLATEAELAQMSVQQIQQFIFKAGFSTAAKVTSVSGRGVGMDVVRTNIEKIGGTVELRSAEGQGSTFVIKIPLTLAIVSALIVECAGERFAIPQISVLELVRVAPNSEHVERIKTTPVLRLRDRLLPLVLLKDMMGLTAGAGLDAPEHYIVVAQVGTYSFGIMVDRVFDTEEIVVKPVSPILRDISMFAGNTILGDGTVVMILDPNGIAAASGQMSTAGVADTAARSPVAAGAGNKQSMLVFLAGSDTPKAVPLALVARLEEIDVAQIEQSDGRYVVQYRGQLMPLVRMGEEYRPRESGRQPMLVFADRDRNMGLLVDRIVDIVAEEFDVKLSSDRAGYIGTAVIAGRATEIVDAGHFLAQAFGSLFAGGEALHGEASQRRRLLLVDDSPFFRNLLAPLLGAAGYAVTTADGADKALALHESGEEFDVIISDIEMPGMNGFEFAESVRKSQRWRTTPMVALSSNVSARDLVRGRQAGFADYVAKFDRDGLLQSISETLTQWRGAA
jgi:two-component system chemotaxis sensor kinase CheA